MPAEPLTSLTAGMALVVGGDQVVRVPAALADAFAPGDRLVAVPGTGDLLHIPAAEHGLVDAAVGAAREAFGALAQVSDAAVEAFYEGFAARLDDDATFAPIAEANAADVDDAARRGRSTTRLVLSPGMRADMAAGLRAWKATPGVRDQLVDEVRHDGWRVELRRAPLGVVGFVFEGRPNVFADAAGVLRSGNTTVLRIGRDALGTARAIVTHALAPALTEAGLPSGSVVLVDSPAHAAGWALFSHPGVALAVARGSGPAVAQLGAVARQAGVPVSLHGTGGAWMVAGDGATPDDLAAAVRHSLDRKVCNTLNTCCIPAGRPDLVEAFLGALEAAAARRSVPARLHVLEGSEGVVPPAWFERTVTVARPGGPVDEPQASTLPTDELGTEWEWETSPEVTLAVTADLDAAVDLCNTWSPKLVASLISTEPAEHEHFWARVDTPFVGNGFTRWVDGQFALGRPELGLSNWENGRLLARGAVLSGDSVFTIRARAVLEDLNLHR